MDCVPSICEGSTAFLRTYAWRTSAWRGKSVAMPSSRPKARSAKLKLSTRPSTSTAGAEGSGEGPEAETTSAAAGVSTKRPRRAARDAGVMRAPWNRGASQARRLPRAAGECAQASRLEQASPHAAPSPTRRPRFGAPARKSHGRPLGPPHRAPDVCGARSACPGASAAWPGAHIAASKA